MTRRRWLAVDVVGQPRLAGRLAAPMLVAGTRAWLLQTLVRLGETERAEQTLAGLGDQDRDDGAMRISLATLRLAQGNLRAAPAALIAEILSLLACEAPAPPAGPRPPPEPLSDSEIRVLRSLPTNLSGPEIASELYISHNTVRAHVRHLYAKLGTHRRAEAVARARALGLLAPSAHRGQAARAG